LPIWRWIGTKIRWLLGYPKIAIASVIAVLVATGICLAFVPATYRVHAEGRAMPEIQHEIYAKADGIVKEVLVVGGGRVKKGQTLLTLDNKELELDLVASKNKIVELSSQVESLGVKLQGALQLGDREQELAIEGERAAASIELSGTETRVRILEERISRLVVVSEFDGVVATFQPEEYLTGRPVKQGDLLLEVMEDEGPWRLELNISEYRMGHVLKSLEKYESLKVRYIAMTEVSQPKYAMLSSVATRADHNERLGAYVRAYAKIDRSEVPDQRIGAEVSAKIRCPDYSLFYSLCGDVVEFVERNVWW
jgi:multidrug resistance efflux pump